MKTCFFIVLGLVVFALLSVATKPAGLKKTVGLLGLLGRLVQRLLDLFFIVINKNLKELLEGDIEQKIPEKKGGD